MHAGIPLRELARSLERAPSYLNGIEHDRRVPSEAVLRQICAEPELDLERLLAAAGRVGEGTEKYLKVNPTAGVLFRKVSGAGLNERHLRQLPDKANEIIRDRDEGPEK